MKAKWNPHAVRQYTSHTAFGVSMERVFGVTVIKPFTKQQAKNTTKGTTWNEAAKCAATRQVMQPPPHLAKVVEPNTVSSSSAFKQYTLLN